jgi:actin-related protein
VRTTHKGKIKNWDYAKKLWENKIEERVNQDKKRYPEKK